MSLTQPAVERQPRSDFELVLSVNSDEAAVGILRQWRDRAAAIVVDHVKELSILLGEAVETEARVIAPFDPGNARLPAFVFRGAVLRCGAGYVVRVAAVVGAVVMKEGRYGQHQSGAKRANPGEGRERIVLAVDVPSKRGWIAGINRHLIKIAARLSDQAELVLRIQVEDERSEAPEAVGGVVADRGGGSLQAEIGAVSVHAGVIGEAIAVAAEVELIIGLIEVAGGEDEFGIVVAFEAGAWGDVEYTVGAVAIVGGVTPALRFHGVDVFWVELGAEVAGDVGVGDGDAVNQPGRLMAAANVQLVVDDVGTGDVVGDQRHAVGSRGAGCITDFQPVDEGGGRDGLKLRRPRVSRDRDRLRLGAKLQLKMQNGSRAGEHSDGLFLAGEGSGGGCNAIFAKWNRVEVKFAVCIGLCSLHVAGSLGLEGDGDVLYRPVLRIMNDAAYGTEDRGESW